jgi:polar amino acid transport system permease protein
MLASLKAALHALPYLLMAAKWTIILSVAGMAIGIVLGAFICAARISKLAPLRLFGALYVSFFRGVPLLVQLIAFYFFLPHIGIDLPAPAAAILSIGMCSAAYAGEILRGALQAIPHGQREAADVLGMPPLALWKRILLPQALRIATPSLVNELILLVKVSSLASVVGIGEITRMAQNINGQIFRPLEVYMTAALIYLAINLVLAFAGRYAERRLAVA